jgi:hypothetical protein
MTVDPHISSRKKKIVVWLIRAMYVSIILGLCDSWIASTSHRDTFFSKERWELRDGGTRGYVGFGYSLTYYREMGGEHGPEIWFWFTPFRIYWTSKRIGASWIWS